MEKGAHKIRPLSEPNSNLHHQREHHNSICSENTLQISFEDLREFSFLHFLQLGLNRKRFVIVKCKSDRSIKETIDTKVPTSNAQIKSAIKVCAW